MYRQFMGPYELRGLPFPWPLGTTHDAHQGREQLDR
jgi:hypothetical protein